MSVHSRTFLRRTVVRSPGAWPAVASALVVATLLVAALLVVTSMRVVVAEAATAPSRPGARDAVHDSVHGGSRRASRPSLGAAHHVAGRWRANATHRLEGTVVVGVNDTLVIEAGTRIAGAPGSRLIVERGATLIARGTALQPIVFTCTQSPASAGCWGGVVIKGAAPVNAGILTSPPAPRTGAANCRELSSSVGGAFGGCDADDASGVLRHVRVEFAGDGLRLEGVGRGTVVSDVEVRRSAGNGVSLFGGTVDLRRLFGSANDAHGLWWSRGWTGRAQQVVLQSHPAAFRSAIFGENGPTLADASNLPRSSPVLFNVTVIAPSWSSTNPHHAEAAAVRLVRGTGVQFVNSILYGAPVGLDIDDAATCSALGTASLRLVITANVVNVGDPDTDAAGCPSEGGILANATQGTLVLPSDTQLLRAPLDLGLPDLRPGSSPVWNSLTPVTPPSDGFFEPAAYVGAVSAVGGVPSVPWYAGWHVGVSTPGVPVITVAAVGASQMGVAGQAVAVVPVARAIDAAGRGVPGLSVSFAVPLGSGSVAVSSTRTDADGLARAGGWTLGAEVGTQFLVASFDGLPDVTFTANAAAPAGQGWLERVAGTNDRVAPPFGTTPVAPAVVVRSPTGGTVAGALVTFAVTAGGGALTGASAVSDASGVARVGSWQLGGSGEQRLAVSSSGRVGTTFRASVSGGGAPLYDVERVFTEDGMQTPWDIDFAPDGTMVLTEAGGRMRVLRPGQSTLAPLAQLSGVLQQGQGGLLGVVFDPLFSANRYLYTYQSVTGPGGVPENRVSRWRVASDWSGLTDRVDIVTGIAWGDSHVGGRMRFDSEGSLFIGTGDTRTGGVPQDLGSMGGKVLRVTRDGQPAPGNPALGAGSDPRIYAYGVRNVQGLARRTNGQMFSCEHGPVAADEVTRLVAGGNGGWHPLRDGDPYGEYRGYEGVWPMTDTTRYPQAMRPTWSTGAVSEGMAPCAFLTGSTWGAWNGALVVGLMSGFRIVVLELSADGRSVTRQWPLEFAQGRARAIAQAPDGSLWIVTIFQGIFRVTPRP